MSLLGLGCQGAGKGDGEARGHGVVAATVPPRLPRAGSWQLSDARQQRHPTVLEPHSPPNPREGEPLSTQGSKLPQIPSLI